jgi:hypothetical protein
MRGKDMEKRYINIFTPKNQKELILGQYGKSTQDEFDACVEILPMLIRDARNGDVNAGQTANEILWALANESFNTKNEMCMETFMTHFQFGQPNKSEVLA